MTPEETTKETSPPARRARRSTPRRKRSSSTTAEKKAAAAAESAAGVQVDVADVGRKGDGAGSVTATKAAPKRRRTRSPRTKAAATAPPAKVAEKVAPAPVAEAEAPIQAERPVESPPPVRPAQEPVRGEPSATDEAGQRRRRSRRGRRGRRGRKENEQADMPLSAAESDVEAIEERLGEAPFPREDDGPELDDPRSEIMDVELDERPSPASARRVTSAEEDEEEELDESFQPSGPQDDNFDPVDFKRKARREMIINVSAGHECRIAVLQDGRLEELFIEREATQSHVGNIYKGRVTNVEASIQAAFIDFGLPKHGFLHISDVQPQYFPNHAGAAEDVGRKIPRHHRPPIQRCFRRGQEVIVQITKEGVGTKGPTLSSYLSIPGRFLVMMPGMSRHGVSRKIEDEAARRQMRDILNELKLPTGMGFILRTAGMDRSRRELQRDLNYLLRLWKTVVERIRSQPSPAELYRESDLLTRTIRDYYTSDFDRLMVDDLPAARRIREFLQIVIPRTKTPIELYADREPLFHRTGIEAEIERINMRHVPLASGGSLVIDSTEAMVAIDVNSGRFRSPENAEETALKINVEAAEEIARQLRLRDLGGLIVCDFIDMRLDKNKRKVENALRDALKKHKERARTLRMSAFGLIEMTRQRQGPSIKRSLYSDCPACKGTGHVKMPESVMLDVMRIIQLAVNHQQVEKVIITVSNDTAFQLLNAKRTALGQIESETGKTVSIRGNPAFTSDQVDYLCEDGRGRQVPIGTGVSPA